MNKNNSKKNKNGFTLIEVIVAIFILVLAVTGPMSAAQNSLKSSFLARDQVIAFYLAQDAIEYLKNYKDQNIIDGVGNIIEQPIMNACEGPEPCDVDTLGNGAPPSHVNKCNSGSCSPLIFNTINKTYSTNGSGVTSKFTRETYIKEIVPDQEYAVTVVIKWKPNFFTPREIVVQENLYNWLSN